MLLMARGQPHGHENELLAGRGRSHPQAGPGPAAQHYRLRSAHCPETYRNRRNGRQGAAFSGGMEAAAQGVWPSYHVSHPLLGRGVGSHTSSSGTSSNYHQRLRPLRPSAYLEGPDGTRTDAAPSTRIRAINSRLAPASHFATVRRTLWPLFACANGVYSSIFRRDRG